MTARRRPRNKRAGWGVEKCPIAPVGEMEGWRGGLEQRRAFGEQGRKLLEINPFTYFDPGDRT